MPASASSIRRVTDLYATAVDYDRSSAATKRFYATVQNKMHFAVHGHTAAELIVERADHTKDAHGAYNLARCSGWKD